MRKARFGSPMPLMFGVRSDGTPTPSREIDFLSEALDSRVSFAGPSHSYINASGVVVQSKLNEWPLEYLNGNPIGRHPPEPASSNLIKDPWFDTMQTTVNPPIDTWGGQGGGLGAVQPDTGINGGPAFNTASGYSKGALYNVTGSSWLIQDGTPWVVVDLSGGWQRIGLSAKVSGTINGRFYPARQDPSNHINYTTQLITGDITVSECRLPWKGTNLNFRHSWPQMELLPFATSPMDGARGEARAAIRDELARSALIQFSNGDSVEVQSSGGVIEIPQSTQNWATRYITKVTLR